MAANSNLDMIKTASIEDLAIILTENHFCPYESEKTECGIVECQKTKDQCGECITKWLKCGNYLLNRIKKCPFCGGISEVERTELCSYRIVCMRCRNSSAKAESPFKAVYLWNRRVGSELP